MSNSRNKRKGAAKPPAHTPREVELRKLDLGIERARAWGPIGKILGGSVGGAILLGAMYPSVLAVAGKETVIDVTFTVALAATLTVSNGLCALWVKREKSNVAIIRKQQEKVEGQLALAQERIKMQKQRIEDLENTNRSSRSHRS